MSLVLLLVFLQALAHHMHILLIFLHPLAPLRKNHALMILQAHPVNHLSTSVLSVSLFIHSPLFLLFNQVYFLPLCVHVLSSISTIPRHPFASKPCSLVQNSSFHIPLVVMPLLDDQLPMPHLVSLDAVLLNNKMTLVLLLHLHQGLKISQHFHPPYLNFLLLTHHLPTTTTTMMVVLLLLLSKKDCVIVLVVIQQMRALMMPIHLHPN
mmetsp:Transcript_21118/g.31438  ORF Transcript_21118/g.31438 Transcript_21118/m.31438 type:complete len:209 (-) Transcript_21118:280-906(-)